MQSEWRRIKLGVCVCVSFTECLPNTAYELSGHPKEVVVDHMVFQGTPSLSKLRCIGPHKLWLHLLL